MSQREAIKPDVKQAAYGGPGWKQRVLTHRQEIGRLWTLSGQDSEWAPLRAVLLHRPGTELAASKDYDQIQMLAPLDLQRAQAEHEAMAAAYRDHGVEVIDLDPPVTPTPNQMFCADLFFMTPQGAILARPASTVRAGEEINVARRLADRGVPILRTLTGTATFEGADAMWLDGETVILGRGHRTNLEAARQITACLAEIGVKTVIVDLPVGTMHLMGMLRIVDQDLALAWPRRAPLSAVEALRERGYEVQFLTNEEEASSNRAFNFVTLGPRKILMVEGNATTQRFYENLEIECVPSPAYELSKAAGAIGCLSGIVTREFVNA